MKQVTEEAAAGSSPCAHNVECERGRVRKEGEGWEGLERK